MDIDLSWQQNSIHSMNSETTVTGNFYYYVVLILLLVSDMHTYLIRAVCDSFSVVPLGGAQFQFDNMLSTMTKYMADMFVIGFRIFLPVFAVHDDNELYTGNHGKGCASDEYVLCRYPVKNYSRIYCIIFDSISNSEHC